MDTRDTSSYLAHSEASSALPHTPVARMRRSLSLTSCTRVSRDSLELPAPPCASCRSTMVL
eukprot:scaffold3708_cov161-Prasinococcus_capsulatus_cf.AAC.1